ncbi:hypothetical protein HD806DRAFT_491829 [Xylariaceae sp. AK1471]|nr:hypothetical protein HD806DRAFT_491829 [Xylariaceae sp. AK1471]
MPEPFATFTAVLGIVNLLRTALRSLHEDATEWKNHPGWSQNNRNIFKDHEESFLDWQRRWMVWIRDDDILSLFWGPKWDKITEELKRIEEVFKTLAKILEETNLENKGSVRKHIGRFWNTFVIRRTDEIEKALGKLERQITSLNKESNRAFFRHPTLRRLDSTEPIPETGPDNARIHQLGLSILLVRLAQDTSNKSNQLHSCALRDHRTLDMELELNHFRPDLKDMDRAPRIIKGPTFLSGTSDATTRVEAVARSCDDSSLHYTFIIKELATERDQLWLRIRATPDPDVDFGYLTFLEAVRYIRDNRDSSGCRLTLSNNETRAWVREEIGHIRGEITSPKPLREVLMTAPTRDAPGFRIIRAHRALQIAEFGLLFFKTTWIGSLCSCTVREMRVTSKNEQDEDEALYILTLRRLTQDAFDVPEAPVGECWCRFKAAGNGDDNTVLRLIRQFPLFSLGLLLIEVALSRPLNDIQIEGQVAHESRIRLKYSGLIAQNNQPLLPRLKDLKEELDRDTDPASPLYPAIKFCIESRLSANTVNEGHLRDYFWNVIDPIFKTYNYYVNLRRQRQ